MHSMRSRFSTCRGPGPQASKRVGLVTEHGEAHGAMHRAVAEQSFAQSFRNFKLCCNPAPGPQPSDADAASRISRAVASEPHPPSFSSSTILHSTTRSTDKDYRRVAQGRDWRQSADGRHVGIGGQPPGASTEREEQTRWEEQVSLLHFHTANEAV